MAMPTATAHCLPRPIEAAETPSAIHRLSRQRLTRYRPRRMRMTLRPLFVSPLSFIIGRAATTICDDARFDISMPCCHDACLRRRTSGLPAAATPRAHASRRRCFLSARRPITFTADTSFVNSGFTFIAGRRPSLSGRRRAADKIYRHFHSVTTAAASRRSAGDSRDAAYHTPCFRLSQEGWHRIFFQRHAHQQQADGFTSFTHAAADASFFEQSGHGGEIFRAHAAQSHATAITTRANA